jgi:hypothetical protein
MQCIIESIHARALASANAVTVVVLDRPSSRSLHRWMRLGRAPNGHLWSDSDDLPRARPLFWAPPVHRRVQNGQSH